MNSYGKELEGEQTMVLYLVALQMKMDASQVMLTIMSDRIHYQTVCSGPDGYYGATYRHTQGQMPFQAKAVRLHQ